MDTISLENMEFYCHHGVMEQEKKVGNIYIVDIMLFLDLSKACLSDNIDDTVNYAEIYSIIKKTILTPCNLLEFIANKICINIKAKFPEINKIKITLKKQSPPIQGKIQYATIIMER